MTTDHEFWAALRRESISHDRAERDSDAAVIAAEDAALALENLTDSRDEAISRAGAW